MPRNCRVLLFLFLLCVVPCMISAQQTEDCANAIDDDGDSLIDLTDPDCDCPKPLPPSLVPNPSFEQRICCPTTYSQMYCAEGWVQASAATTDYIHMCELGDFGTLDLPLPFPDGEGCVGFLDGAIQDNYNPNWKEYAGACLISPLQAGGTYKFEFYVGFLLGFRSPPIDITLFGATSCSKLPFGDRDAEFGCPTNGPGWIELGHVNVVGNRQWRETSITVSPVSDIHAIALGPPCKGSSISSHAYYLLDNLILADWEAFGPVVQLTGHPCEEGVSLSVSLEDTLSYQWYKDGIALEGETAHVMSQLYGDGVYQVRVITPNTGCRTSDEFLFELPRPSSEEVATICEGESYFFNGNERTVKGTYLDTLQTADGCDSIIQLNLEVFANKGDTIFAKIYPNEPYDIGRARFYNPGTYTVDLTSSQGCDSTVLLNLSYYDLYAPNAFSPNDDGINDLFAIGGGEDLISIPHFRVFNRWGVLMYESTTMIPNNTTIGWNGRAQGRSAPEGVYIFQASLVFDDGQERIVGGTFTLFR